MFDATEAEARETWLGSAIAKRYRWAGVVAFGLLVPGALLASGRLNQMIRPTTVADRQRLTPTRQAAPPISTVQAAAASVPTAPANDEALMQLLHEFTATQQTPFGIVIKDLKTGVVTTSSPGETFNQC